MDHPFLSCQLLAFWPRRWIGPYGAVIRRESNGVRSREAGVRFSYAGQTDRGQVRADNQDTFLAVPEQGLFVVADGMGGHVDGALASRIVVQAMHSFYVQSSGQQPDAWPLVSEGPDDLDARRAVSALEFAHGRLRSRARAAAARDKAMGATVVALHLSSGKACVIHAGDSRCYHGSGWDITRLTRDHVAEDDSDRSGIRGHAVYRAVCADDSDARPDVTLVWPMPGDLFVLCSDGLTDELDDEALSRIIRSQESVDDLCRELVAEAVALGGRDNITVLVVKIDE